MDNRTTLVVGASGATGKQLVGQLLDMGQAVKIIVRSTDNLPPEWKENDRLTIIRAGVSEIGVEEMSEHVRGCHAVASCLGHNLNLKGLYGKPRKLVRDAVSLLSEAIRINEPDRPARLVLMNTAGYRNRDADKPVSFGHRFVVGLLRLTLPPHVDNEMAAEYLRTSIGLNDPFVEWVVVRPDSLTDQQEVSDYEVHPSPVRDTIFNAGTTSRINVGHFMASLMTDDDLWDRWKGQMPVIYNKVTD